MFQYPTRILTISIHALREESDDHITPISVTYSWISIHALREESDIALTVRCKLTIYFNPRSP
ncbi:Uncharacterised protein [uncultured Ruminococcus sp.]|nr:Uncharacterised protein [uncultured Ruminococcus sp.]